MITVVYYTSNREDEAFESRIRLALLGAIGDTPLISVSQKPMDFGKNICVGDIGVSDYNILIQLRAGARAAETPLVATAEADCLYPHKGYFDFVPPGKFDWVYRNTNLWIYKRTWGNFRRKAYSLCAQIAGRDYLIELLDKKIVVGPGVRGDIVHKTDGWTPFHTDIPCINIKTPNGMRRTAGTERGIAPEERLPHWGSADDIAEAFYVS
jgi:hypothetical protein